MSVTGPRCCVRPGIEVRIVDPKRVRSFALSAGRLAKNDAIDAEMIAWFAETFDEAPSQTHDAAREELAALVKALEAKDVEDTGKVVTERHQAPFAANLVEAAHQEVAIAGAAFESAEGMLHDGGAAAHQFVCAMHPCAMTFENIFVLPAGDDTCRCLSAETPCP